MRSAIIGLGGISVNHADALKNINGDIVAVCDIVPEKIKSFKAKFSLNSSEYTDYKEMLRRERLDVVHVCTPHYLHSEMICACLDLDINVFCEKPVAISYEQLDDIRKSAANSKAILGVSHQNRYNENIRYAKKILSSSEVTSGVGIIAWCRDERYYSQAEWRGKWASEGGGVAINQAIHTIDLLQYFCGMPGSVVGHISNNSLAGVIEVEDTCFGLFDTESGSRFSIMATNAMTHTHPFVLMLKNAEHSVTVLGDSAMIVDGVLITREERTKRVGKNEWGTGHTKIIEDFYGHIERGERFPIDNCEAEKAVKMILEMYNSNGEKRIIK